MLGDHYAYPYELGWLACDKKLVKVSPISAPEPPPEDHHSSA